MNWWTHQKTIENLGYMVFLWKIGNFTSPPPEIGKFTPPPKSRKFILTAPKFSVRL